jgi:hypothetical protein
VEVISGAVPSAALLHEVHSAVLYSQEQASARLEAALERVLLWTLAWLLHQQLHAQA